MESLRYACFQQPHTMILGFRLVTYILMFLITMKQKKKEKNVVSENGIDEGAGMNPLITENQQQTTNINYRKCISITTKGYDKFLSKIPNSFL